MTECLALFRHGDIYTNKASGISRLLLSRRWPMRRSTSWRMAAMLARNFFGLTMKPKPRPLLARDQGLGLWP